VRLLAVIALGAACDAPTPRILSTTVPGDTRDVLGPYVVQLAVRDVTGDDRVEVRYGIDATTFLAVEAEAREGRGDLYAAGIPGQPRGTQITLFTTILRDGLEVVRDPPLASGTYYAFTILALERCRVDSDCAPGQICVETATGDAAACVAYEGACVGETRACPDGSVCEGEICVIAVVPCAADDDCPSAEECVLERGECRPRRPCSEAEPCPDGEICRPEVGLCFDS
jgi:hypothetical protein